MQESENNNKSVIFPRVSSKEQEEGSYSLPAQEKLLRSYCERKEFKVTKVFSISESASGRKQRKIFDEMMGCVTKNKINKIIFEKIDRCTRNFNDMIKVEKWLNEDEQREIHFVKNSLVLTKNSRSQDKLNWSINVVLAKNYIDNLSEEVKKGQKEKLEQGWLPFRPPIGYKTVTVNKEKIHIVDEEKAPYIRRLFELYATGNYSIKSVNNLLYDEGLRTKSGKQLSKSRINNTLIYPFYYGMIRWDGKLYQGKHEPLISKELFDKVQDILKRKTTPKYNKHHYTFKGLIRCKECGGMITWEKQKGIMYGHCNHYRNCTQKKWAREKDLENQIDELFENLMIKHSRIVEWIREAVKESHQNEIEYHSNALNELNGQYKLIQHRLGQLYDDKLDGRIAKDFYERKFQQYTEEKDNVVESIKKHSLANNKYLELGMGIYDVSQKAHELYYEGSAERKRELINMVFENLTLIDGVIGYNHTEEFKVIAELAKQVNSSKIEIIAINPSENFEPAEIRCINEKNNDKIAVCSRKWAM